MKDRVEIRFEGNIVQDLSLIVLKIWNRGGLAVRREDFDEPIKFEFTGRSCITGEVLSIEPEDVINENELKNFLMLGLDGSVRLSRFLLNPSETVKIKLLLSGRGKIRGSARIADGKLVSMNPDERPTTYKILPMISALFMSLGTTFITVHYLIVYGNVNFTNLFFQIFEALCLITAVLTPSYLLNITFKLIFSIGQVKFQWW